MLPQVLEFIDVHTILRKSRRLTHVPKDRVRRDKALRTEPTLHLATRPNSISFRRDRRYNLLSGTDHKESWRFLIQRSRLNAGCQTVRPSIYILWAYGRGADHESIATRVTAVFSTVLNLGGGKPRIHSHLVGLT